MNSLTSLHLCFSQWQANNGQSSFVWLFRYQSYFWLFFWLVEFFWDWNAKGSAKHVYFRVQLTATQSKCSTGCVRLSGVDETPNPRMQNSSHVYFYISSLFLRTMDLTREDSKHYANFRRTQSNQVTRFVSRFKKKMKKAKKNIKNQNVNNKTKKHFNISVFKIHECYRWNDKGADRSFLIVVLLCHFSEDASPKQENKIVSDIQEINDPIYVNMEIKVWHCFILLKNIKCIITAKLTVKNVES